MNVVVVGEHVGDIEISDRTINEGTRDHVHRLPYKQDSKIIVIGCVTQVIKGLNQLPSENGVPMTDSPKTLITGLSVPDYHQLITGLSVPDYHQVKKLNFGYYVQAYDGRRATNPNRSRSVCSIALHPSGIA